MSAAVLQTTARVGISVAIGNNETIEDRRRRDAAARRANVLRIVRDCPHRANVTAQDGRICKPFTIIQTRFRSREAAVDGHIVLQGERSVSIGSSRREIRSARNPDIDIASRRIGRRYSILQTGVGIRPGSTIVQSRRP